MSDAAHMLLQELVEGGWQFVDDLTDERRQETLHLDFKAKADPTKSALDRDDKKNFSKALSGFANSAGGIIVWGVEARRASEGVDVAVAVHPISGLDAFVSHLHSYEPDATEPFVTGVEHHPIPDPTSASSGVVVTLIPESDSTPHMALAPREHRYYKRSGDQFRAMEHFEVADMFGRRPQPKLVVEIGARVQVAGSGNSGKFGRIELKFVMKNLGRGLARFPCLSLSDPTGWPIREYNGVMSPALPQVPSPANWSYRFAGTTDHVVFPQDEIDAAFVYCELPPGQKEFPDLELRYSAIADGCAPIGDSIRVAGSALKAGWEEAKTGTGKIQLPITPA